MVQSSCKTLLQHIFFMHIAVWLYVTTENSVLLFILAGKGSEHLQDLCDSMGILVTFIFKITVTDICKGFRY